MTQRILFVCLGNICRSPTAEGVFRTLAERAGLTVEVDSCGTGNWHAGEPPSVSAIAAAAARGYDLAPLRARQVSRADFTRFDRIYAMDRTNLRDLRALCPSGGVQPAALLSLAPHLGQDVPDPWYTGEYERTLDLIEEALRALVAELVAARDQPEQ